jgi:ppGpp synthetase/RelA/SpoT-type nucleotidyltranferase
MDVNQSSTIKINEKPTDPVAYNTWLQEHFGLAITNDMQIHYEAATAKMKQDFEASSFWNELITRNLKEYSDQYLSKTRYPLLVHPDRKPELKLKSWRSFQDKILRQNIIKNANWPNQPKDGWILPNNWYSRINDIIRTRIEVKYLDGTTFLAEKLKSLCGKTYDHCDWEAKEEGYYAVHFYLKKEFEIPAGLKTERVDVLIEIQITTQIQEVISQLLHEYYDQKRSKILPVPELIWQWNYRSEEFKANYLGHILHYLEGMIMEIRDKEKP